MIDCGNSEIRELLPDMLHDSLAPELRQRVAAHMSACAACTEEYDLLRSVYALGAARVVNVSGIASSIAPYRRRPWIAMQPVMRIAASIAIVAIGAGSYSIVSQTIRAKDAGIGESAIVSLADTMVPTTAVAGDPVTVSADVYSLDQQAMQELLAKLEQKLGEGMPVEPRPLVRNPKVSGN